jgi:hypothetical protein
VIRDRKIAEPLLRVEFLPPCEWVARTPDGRIEASAAALARVHRVVSAPSGFPAVAPEAVVSRAGLVAGALEAR